ncbi:gephyrin-like molybdotransferase Glp [Nocardia sp. NPDC057353]|uniref:molybdopterin molybdotransferase MoeA n=1 Tax=Nocardia sp. NPDC057353 TaxID=3346104 RepID=UPI00363DB75A
MNSRPALAPARAVDDYRATVAELLRPAGPRPVRQLAPVAALHAVLAADVHSPLELPVFRNSAMDGYALRAESVLVTPVTLPLAGVLAAGAGELAPVPAGAAVKVMTGAPVPPGADCVVPVEDTRSDGATVTVERGRGAGEFIREAGTDVRRGELLVPAGTRLAPRHVAALAAVGLPTVPVFAPVRAAVLTTGDELMPAGVPLRPGAIYNSNGAALAAALADSGAEVVSVAHSTDDHGEFRALLAAAVAVADVVFTSGGVSQGDFEVVKEVLGPLGGVFGAVAMQPGGPQGYTVVDGVPVLSFPGNPVSTAVSFEVFARPVLRELAGLAQAPEQLLPLRDPIRSPAGKRQYLRGALDGDGVRVVAGPGSHLVAGMARADALVEVPEAVTELPAGAVVRVWSL